MADRYRGWANSNGRGQKEIGCRLYALLCPLLLAIVQVWQVNEESGQYLCFRSRSRDEYLVVVS